MKKYITLLLLFSGSLMMAQNYVLDTTFANGGIAMTGLNFTPRNGFFEGGKYYFFGSSNILTRFNFDGSLDSTFGSYTGIQLIALPSGSLYVKDVTMHNGQIYVFGRREAGTTASVDGLLMRYTTDGLLDTTFGVNGIVSFDLGQREFFSNILVNPDGTIFAIGTKQSTTYNGEVLLCKFLADGTLDTSFNTTGYKVFPYINIATGVSITPHGTGFLLGKWTNTGSYADVFIEKIDADGTTVATFGVNGIVRFSVDIYGSAAFDNFKQLQIIGDRIYCSFSWGVSFNAHGNYLQAYSLTAPHTKLFSKGIYSDSYFKVLNSGKVMVARGFSCPSPSCYSTSFKLNRYNADGANDTSFNGNGAFTYEFSPFTTFTEGASFFYVHADERILIGGAYGGFNMLRIGDPATLGTDHLTGAPPFVFYPNPASEVLHIQNNTGRLIGKIRITDILGKTYDAFPEGNDIDVSQLQKGVYFINIESEGEVFRLKFVKS